MYYARKPAYLTKIRKTYGKTLQVDGFAPVYLVCLHLEWRHENDHIILIFA